MLHLKVVQLSSAAPCSLKFIFMYEFAFIKLKQLFKLKVGLHLKFSFQNCSMGLKLSVMFQLRDKTSKLSKNLKEFVGFKAELSERGRSA